MLPERRTGTFLNQIFAVGSLISGTAVLPPRGNRRLPGAPVAGQTGQGYFREGRGLLQSCQLAKPFAGAVVATTAS